MKAPVGLSSDRTVLRSKMEGPRPEQECRERSSLPQWYDAVRHILLGIIWRKSAAEPAASLLRPPRQLVDNEHRINSFDRWHLLYLHIIKKILMPQSVIHEILYMKHPNISSFYAKESRLCKPCAEKPLIRANVQTVCRKCAAAFLHKERTPNLTIWRSKSGASPGTRTLGPLINRASRRFVSIYGSFELSLFLIKAT